MTNRERVNEIEVVDVPLPQRRRTRGLLSQISAVLLQPVYFFRTLPHLSETRQWLWAGLIILFLIGFSAVRYNVVSQAGATDETNTPPPIDFGGGLEGDGGIPIPGGDLGGGIDFGGIPDPSAGGGGESPATPEQNLSETLTIGFIAASEIVVNWLIISVLLIIVSLLRGRLPRFGHNFQIAIWATLPLAVMALLQVLFYAAGGTTGQPGLAGLLLDWEFYQQQSPLAQDIMYSLAIRLTVFWMWTLALLYFGARNALQGPRLGAMLIVVFWAAIVVLVPVATGAVAAPEAEESLTGDEFPTGEGEFFPPGVEIPEGEFPGGFPPSDFPGQFATEEFGSDEADNAQTDDFSIEGEGEMDGSLLTEEGAPSSEVGGEGAGEDSILSPETTSEIEIESNTGGETNAQSGNASVNVRPTAPPVEGENAGEPVEVRPRP